VPDTIASDGDVAPEVVASYAEQFFDRAFQRFRVQANKKYRYPFRPALSFNIVRETQAPAPGKALAHPSPPPRQAQANTQTTVAVVQRRLARPKSHPF
jgi:hypothetical protein